MKSPHLFQKNVVNVLRILNAQSETSDGFDFEANLRNLSNGAPCVGGSNVKLSVPWQQRTAVELTFLLQFNFRSVRLHLHRIIRLVASSPPTPPLNVITSPSDSCFKLHRRRENIFHKKFSRLNLITKLFGIARPLIALFCKQF